VRERFRISSSLFIEREDAARKGASRRIKDERIERDDRTPRWLDSLASIRGGYAYAALAINSWD